MVRFDTSFLVFYRSVHSQSFKYRYFQIIFENLIHRSFDLRKNVALKYKTVVDRAKRDSSADESFPGRYILVPRKSPVHLKKTGITPNQNYVSATPGTLQNAPIAILNLINKTQFGLCACALGESKIKKKDFIECSIVAWYRLSLVTFDICQSTFVIFNKTFQHSRFLNISI